MKKKESVVIARAMYVQSTINKRPAGSKIETVVREISEKLFLSDATVWKDYQKHIPTPEPEKKTAGRNRY
jgi:hypothetical protein